MAVKNNNPDSPIAIRAKNAGRPPGRPDRLRRFKSTS
jgi:hypothetical protein